MDFNEYFICNFNDDVPKKGEYHALDELWFGELTTNNLRNVIERYLLHKNVCADNGGEQLLAECIQLTLAFVRNNFTGPFAELQTCCEMIDQLQLENCDPFERLKASGEEINPNVRTGQLLLFSKEIIAVLKKAYPDSVIVHWWHMRITCIHQHILDNLADELYRQFKPTAEWLISQMHRLKSKDLQCLLYLEVANGFLQYHRSERSQCYLKELCEFIDVSLKVEGLLGKRTQFQNKPLPQLCLKIEQLSENNLPSLNTINARTELPKLLLLNDDTRLERITFEDPKDNEVMTLPSVLQALVLAQARQIKRSRPVDRLGDEEIEPLIRTLLFQSSGPLQVRLSALLLNCDQESNMRRTIERSWKQCDECLNILDDSMKYTLRERLSYGFASFLQPKWHLQLQLCGLLRSLGMTKTALDVYLKIHAWDQVIECYTSLELRHKAAEIIKQELSKKPSVLLWCLLGDAEDDTSCYEKAWELSNHTSGKAQACWGMHYFRRGDYKSGFEHLQKSIQINMLQERILLYCGYAAIQLERWKEAVSAYIAYTHLEPNGFESWNNLAKALIKLGDRERAYKVLSESLKCNFNNWKVWENFLLISVDTGHLSDAMRSYSRLCDLKIQYIDIEVLCRIIRAVEKLSNVNENYESLHKQAVSLLSQQCVKHRNVAEIWELAALLAKTPLKKSEKLVKAYGAYTSTHRSWSNIGECALKAMKLCLDICTNSLAALEDHSEEESRAMLTSQLNSARLSTASCINAISRGQCDLTEDGRQMLDKLRDFHEKVKETADNSMTYAVLQLNGN